MEGARARKVRPEKGHLVSKDAPSLEIDILGMVGCEGDGQQLHARFLGQVSRLAIVTAPAGGDHIVPGVCPALTDGTNMVPGQLGTQEPFPAVETYVTISLEECAVAQERDIPGREVFTDLSNRGDDGMDDQNALAAREGADAAMQPEEWVAAGVEYLFEVVEMGGLLIIEPFQRQAAGRGPQHMLREWIHDPPDHCIHMLSLLATVRHNKGIGMGNTQEHNAARCALQAKGR